jgi:nucleotide-binding universal stress UspA family protein
MSFKTILVHCDASSKLSRRLDVPVDLSQRFGAHLVGVHVQAPIHIPAFSVSLY